MAQYRPGLTLMELLIAVILGVVILLGIGQVDVTRIYISDQARRSSTQQTEASIAASHMLKTLLQADRVNLATLDSIQVRMPPEDPTRLDDPTAYRWVQYRYDSAAQQILYFDPASPCTVSQRFGDCAAGVQSSACFTNLTMQYRNETDKAPPGGDPSGTNLAPPDDNNVLEMTVEWTDPQTSKTQQFVSQMTIRAGAYTNLSTGLSPAGPAFDPPSSC